MGTNNYKGTVCNHRWQAGPRGMKPTIVITNLLIVEFASADCENKILIAISSKDEESVVII